MFRYNVSKRDEDVKIDIYNTLGQTIETLVDKQAPGGNHEITFDAQDLPSGIYYYSIQAGDFQDVKMMIVIK